MSEQITYRMLHEQAAGMGICPEFFAINGINPDAPVPWYELVEEIRKQHNGIFGVRLFFGHDGHNVCRFDTYDETLAEGESGRSMQEAVERCISAWKLEAGARWFAKNPDYVEPSAEQKGTE